MLKAYFTFLLSFLELGGVICFKMLTNQPQNKPRNLKIIELYVKEKLSMAQIAERLEVSPSVVRYTLTKANVSRRTIKE
jgi:predicted DNA-binding protein YlxM (UPF0122 family)